MAISTVATFTTGVNIYAVEGLAPGDVIVWLWRARKNEDAVPSDFVLGTPASVLNIQPIGGGANVSWSIATTDSSTSSITTWPNYVFKDYAGWAATEGHTTAYQEIICLCVWPIDGFVTGDYMLTFTMPTYAVSELKWGKVLRGVNLANFCKKSPIAADWDYSTMLRKTTNYAGATTHNDFPVTVTITAPSAYMLTILGEDSPPADLCSYASSQSVDVYGTKVYGYTRTAYVLGSPDVNNGGAFYDKGFVSTEHIFTAPLLDESYSTYGSGTNFYLFYMALNAIAPPATVYFTDLLVFNAAAGRSVEF